MLSQIMQEMKKMVIASSQFYNKLIIILFLDSINDTSSQHGLNNNKTRDDTNDEDDEDEEESESEDEDKEGKVLTYDK